MIAAQDIFDPTNWINFGVTGVVIVSIVFGWLWAKPAVDELKRQAESDRQRAEKAEAQRDEAFQIAQDKIVPLLGQFVDTTRTLMPLLQDVVQRSRERRDD